ncbi:sulfate transporter family-domain-containing protein [Radiomyces spectabilis]|uniref:sulfate transporter family-domain-containing protein n=1 Tax=Radiomyces spectabilis TaxID=64574 RepID=UPI002220D5B1|nr:sulfate transporter family-domain-containing protein [Radiomyces spectabilis]KAI8365198.1 sulfate transporter family-domain-containing protein [Radiomyces spectabilis]
MSTLFLDEAPRPYTKAIPHIVQQLPNRAKSFSKELFPITEWLPKYNLKWLSSDLVCAITVGTIVVPQSMAYAKIANLPPEFGLYSSFVGVMIYPFLGTSKDISIGTTAIMSLLVGQIVASITTMPQFLSGAWTYNDIAVTLALFAGLISLVVGILRLGILFRFICQPAIAGFMAGSGLTIIINQFNKIFGIPNIKTTEAPYLVFGKTLINLHHTHIDAVFGLLSLVWLYGIRYIATKMMTRYPRYANVWFYINITRNIVVIVVTTLISYLINHFAHYTQSPFKILGPIASGFQHMGVPDVDTSLLSHLMKDMPGIIVLLVMEHGAIATSLGKVSDYKVEMNQEIIAIGLTNVFASFFGAYPSTGAFSRSAVMSKSGARTPFANFFVGIIVILALYAFTPAFQYIPDASLAAVIAHAVTDLISGPSVWLKFWKLHPSELLIFAAAYIIALLTRIDISVYVPVGLSLIIQLYRVARPDYAVLGRLDLQQPLNYPQEKVSVTDDLDRLEQAVFYSTTHPTLGQYVRPIGRGIVCFQPRENLVFQNADYITEKLVDEIKATTRRGKPLADKVGDRPWNDARQSKKGESEKPLLRSVILDLSGVHQIDYTGIEGLIDAAKMAERYSGQSVRWYIVVGSSLAVRKALLFAGFGRQRRQTLPNGFFVSDLDQRRNHSDPARGHRVTDDVCTKTREDAGNNEDINATKPEEHVVVIENVAKEYDRQDLTQLSDDPSNSPRSGNDSTANKHASVSTDGSSDWCYCDEKPPQPADGDIIGAVRDRYPFFFRTLHEAARAALMHPGFEGNMAHDSDISFYSEQRDLSDEEQAAGARC